ncbi:MAG: HpaII family restriction endonuclease, partial [Fusobacteriaceae bacterium]
MRYNKGEWSEIYTYLKCLLDGKFYVKDSSLENILSEYEILEIFRKNYLNNRDFIFNPKAIDSIKYNHEVQKLLQKLLSTNTTTFELPELEDFAKAEDFSLNKGNSLNKSDLDARIKDHYGVESNKKEYSIKSQLASPATLLNASSHTNFL